MADEKTKDTLAQEPEDAKAADAADNKDAEKLSKEEVDAVAGGGWTPCGSPMVKFR